MNYTQEQARQIYQDAKSRGLDPDKVMSGLVSRGAIIEGIDMAEATQYSQKKMGVQKAPTGIFETAQDIRQIGTGIGEDINRRVGRVSDIQESDISGLRKATQVFGQGLGAFQDVLGQGIKGIVKVALPQTAEEGVKEGISSAMNIKPVQDIVSQYEEINQKNPELARDIDTVFNTVMTALDVAGFGVVSAGKKAARSGIKSGARGVVDDVVRTGDDAAMTGVRKTAQDIGSAIIPARERLVNSTISKALDLTQGDLRNIKNATGNDVGRWVADNNLIRGTLEETDRAINEFGTNAKALRDAEINKVANVYNPDDVPRYKDALNEVIGQIENKIGFESTVSEAKNLLAKENINLADVQRAKELMDEAFNLYKITGDVSESTTKEGLSRVRKELRKFVEDEVSAAGGEDIFKLNNDLATARSLEKQIKARSTRDLTRANLQLGDFATFGAGSFAGGPLGGLIALAAKKTMQNPPAMLRFAKWLDGLNDTKKAKIKATLESGEIPEEVIKKLDDVSEQTK